MDEAYLDVTEQVEGSFEKAKEHAEKMKAQVKAEVGIAFTVALTKTNSFQRLPVTSINPTGSTIVTPDKVAVFPVALACGSPSRRGQKNQRPHGIHRRQNHRRLRKRSIQRLTALFGKASGLYFFNSARGIDNEPVQEAGEQNP